MHHILVLGLGQTSCWSGDSMRVERAGVTDSSHKAITSTWDPEVCLIAGAQSTRGGLVEEGAVKVCLLRLGRAFWGTDGLTAGKKPVSAP